MKNRVPTHKLPGSKRNNYVFKIISKKKKKQTSKEPKMLESFNWVDQLLFVMHTQDKDSLQIE